MDKDFDDVPLSQSTISKRLAEIQRRCSQLADDPDELSELSLEDTIAKSDKGNPYNTG
ncbi:MAG: hypothetical protein IIB75_10530 [Proteobacteria bacterium]|nr:hypothetical protein [Pseudomonadota bacterium]